MPGMAAVDAVGRLRTAGPTQDTASGARKKLKQARGCPFGAIGKLKRRSADPPPSRFS